MITERLNQVQRFVSVGFVVALFNVALFEVLFRLTGFYLKASIVAFIITVFVSFLLQRTITFGNTTTLVKKKTVRELTLLYLNALLGLGINTSIMFLGVEVFSVNPSFCQWVSIAVLATYNFFIYRLILT